MDIAWFRDLFICILGGVGSITLIIIAVLTFRLYLKLSSILNSSKAICSNIQDFTSCLRNEVLKPLMQLVALIQGVRKGIETMGYFHKKEGGKDG